MRTVSTPFPWGLKTADMEIGQYTVRAFHPYKVLNGRVTSEPDQEVTHYHGYIDGKDCNETWVSLDEALVGLIVRRNVGLNHRQINEHFMAGLHAMAGT